MRTVTNVYLLNLAVSDLLLGVFCMPFTLVGQVLRNFIFGPVMCKLIPYFQAVCVSVGVWTLVAISLERYFAICRPLKSRRWQTQFHAYKMIAFVWACSLIWTCPIVAVSRLKAMKMGRHKCREEWPNPTSEKAFNLFIDAILLLVPLIIMTLAYSLIVHKLCKGLKNEIQHCTKFRKGVGRSATRNGVVVLAARKGGRGSVAQVGTAADETRHRHCFDRHSFSRTGRKASRKCDGRGAVRGPNGKPNGKFKFLLRRREDEDEDGDRVTLSKRRPDSNNLISSPMLIPVVNVSFRLVSSEGDSSREDSEKEETFTFEDQPSYPFSRHAIRSTYMDKSIEAKKKVIRMLFVIVAEFFVCWAPLHVLNTWYLFYPEVIYRHVGSTGVSLVQLLAYISSCCNPITYCFMNKKFRQAFLSVFQRHRFCSCGESKKADILKLDTIKGGHSVVYKEGMVNIENRSEIIELESEDHV